MADLYIRGVKMSKDASLWLMIKPDGTVYKIKDNDENGPAQQSGRAVVIRTLNHDLVERPNLSLTPDYKDVRNGLSGWHTIKHVLEVLMSLYRNCTTSSLTGPLILRFVEEIMLSCSDDVRFGDICNVRYTVEHSDRVSWEGTITVTVPNGGD